jgi:hypothetical protein
LGRDAERSVVNLSSMLAEGRVLAFTDQMLSDSIGVGSWVNSIRQALKDSYIQSYLFGLGGQQQLTQRDYGSIGGMLADQYKYLNSFAAEIAAGNLTPGQIRARIAMYARSAREAYERANARAWGIPDGALPAIPGDGSSCEGLTRCACSWVKEETPGGVNCYWTLGVAEHCSLCLLNSTAWNPLFIPIEGAPT